MRVIACTVCEANPVELPITCLLLLIILLLLAFIKLKLCSPTYTYLVELNSGQVNERRFTAATLTRCRLFGDMTCAFFI